MCLGRETITGNGLAYLLEGILSSEHARPRGGLLPLLFRWYLPVFWHSFHRHHGHHGALGNCHAGFLCWNRVVPDDSERTPGPDARHPVDDFLVAQGNPLGKMAS